MRSGFWQQRCVLGAPGILLTLLLSGTSWNASAGDAKPLTAILLTARAELPDPNFADALVLVMNNLGPAPIGVIVNRPTKVAVAQLFPDLERVAKLQDKLYFGGPVDVESVWFLFRAARPPKHAMHLFDDLYLSASRDLLLRLLARDKPMDGVRVFIGHSGWGPGQLEAEIARGDWTLAHANPDAMFNGKSEHPWPGPKRPKDST